MRPGYQEAKREHAYLHKAEGQAQIPYIPVSEGSVRTTNSILRYKSTWNGRVFIGRSTLRNRKIQNANNHHHLQAGHQAQHGGVRLLVTKVGRNGTHMGGRTKNGQTKW